jgi:DNA-directed RNA polymerase specialized sigma24 family protein
MTLHLEPEELKLAEKVAARIGSKWSAVDVDDLTGHLYLWLLTNIKSVERWRDETGDGKLYVSLRREAAKYCAKEQAAAVGRPITAGNFYTVELLDRALPYVFEETPQTLTTVNPVTGKPEGSSAEPGLAMTIMTDVRAAYYGLNREIQEVLAWRYRDGLTLEEIGELRNLTKAGAGKSLERALSRLSDSLAGNPL